MNKRLSKRYIANIVAKSLMIQTNSVNIGTKAKDIDKWDSLGKIRIILSLQKEFKIKISTKELKFLNSIDSIYELIKKK